MPTHTIRNLNAVSQTLLIPLYFRAMGEPAAGCIGTRSQGSGVGQPARL